MEYGDQSHNLAVSIAAWGVPDRVNIPFGSSIGIAAIASAAWSVMTEILRSALVPFTCQQMFDLVADIESYPDFLPWCRSAVVHSRGPMRVEASVEVARGPFRGAFTTENALRPPERITMRLLRGPFKHLDGSWLFENVGEQGTRVSLEMRFDMRSGLLKRTLGPVFSQIANSMVDAFCRRARALYDG